MSGLVTASQVCDAGPFLVVLRQLLLLPLTPSDHEMAATILWLQQLFLFVSGKWGLYAKPILNPLIDLHNHPPIGWPTMASRWHLWIAIGGVAKAPQDNCYPCNRSNASCDYVISLHLVVYSDSVTYSCNSPKPSCGPPNLLRVNNVMPKIFMRSSKLAAVMSCGYLPG